MKVEILEERLSAKDRHVDPPRLIVAEKGDIVTVSDETGKKWCEQGWARDLSGAVATGERRVEGATLKPHKMKVQPKTAEV